jgi:hypothetical protein
MSGRKPMKSATVLSQKHSEQELDAASRTRESRPPQPAQGGRWWFVFDRWLAVSEPANADDEFVMA